MLQLFARDGVDTSFGCFAAIFGVNSGPFSERALIQIDIGEFSPDHLIRHRLFRTICVTGMPPSVALMGRVDFDLERL